MIEYDRIAAASCKWCAEGLTQPVPGEHYRPADRLVDRFPRCTAPTRDEVIEQQAKHIADLIILVNCGGPRTGKRCSVDGHEIYGPFITDGPSPDDKSTCELHWHRQKIEQQARRIAELEREIAQQPIQRPRGKYVEIQIDYDVWLECCLKHAPQLVPQEPK